MKPIQNRAEQFESLLRERIVILDGAMGTMVQQHKLDEAAYRGERFKDSHRDLQGLHDLLCLTQPNVVEGIHKQYFEAGADLIETNTFNAQALSLADYGMEGLAYEINLAAAQCARPADRNGFRQRRRTDHARTRAIAQKNCADHGFGHVYPGGQQSRRDRTDGGSVLEFHLPRPAAQCGFELRTRTKGTPPARRRTRERRADIPQRLSQCRPAEPAFTDRFPRNAGDARAAVEGLGPKPLVEHCRRLLRHDAAPHRSHRRSRRGHASSWS